jgi:hypothetical protein
LPNTAFARNANALSRAKFQKAGLEELQKTANGMNRDKKAPERL